MCCVVCVAELGSDGDGEGEGEGGGAEAGVGAWEVLGRSVGVARAHLLHPYPLCRLVPGTQHTHAQAHTCHQSTTGSSCATNSLLR